MSAKRQRRIVTLTPRTEPICGHSQRRLQVDVILDIMSGKGKGTLFLAHTNLDFDLMHYLNNEY